MNKIPNIRGMYQCFTDLLMDLKKCNITLSFKKQRRKDKDILLISKMRPLRKPISLQLPPSCLENWDL